VEELGRQPRRASVPFAKHLRRGLAGIIGAVVTGGLAGWYYLNHRALPPEFTETLFEGVQCERIVRRRPRPLIVYIVRIDLTTPGLRFRVTPGERNKKLPLVARTTSGYLQESGAQLAINGDFFSPWHSTTPWDYYPHVGDRVKTNGRACSNGVCYAVGPPHDKLPALFLTANNNALISRRPPSRAWMYNVISGSPLLVEDGKVRKFRGTDLHPRTAVALDRTGKTLLLILVDGRQKRYSEGVTMSELAQLIRDEGGWNALNLDGGGSTTLAVSENGTPHVLNSPIDTHIPGRERPIANHLAVFAPPVK
jgi:hypothetical protein